MFVKFSENFHISQGFFFSKNKTKNFLPPTPAQSLFELNLKMFFSGVPNFFVGEKKIIIETFLSNNLLSL